MAFEIVGKGVSNSVKLQPNMISIGKYGACFSNDATKLFSGYEYCEVYLDKENNRIAFKPSNNNITGFKVGEDKGKGRKSVTGAWARTLISGRYVFASKNGLLIVNDCMKQEDEELQLLIDEAEIDN